jgi:hypothetical protein
LSEQAYDAGGFDFGGDDFDWSGIDPGLYEIEVDGETYTVGDPEAEAEMTRQAMAQELHESELDRARGDVRETWPDMPEGVLKMLQAEDAESLRDTAATVAHRLGLTRADANQHPGAGPSRAAQLEGSSALERARSLGRQGDPSAYMALKDAAAFAQSGTPLTDHARARIAQALNFARQVGDAQAVEFLARQLGEGR